MKKVVTGLTAYQTERLMVLAKKGGIDLQVELAPKLKLTRKEVGKIEKALIASDGKAVVLVKKNGNPVRVFSKQGYKQIGLGMTNYHKNKGTLKRKDMFLKAAGCK